jgi:hypothetical protein
MNDQLSHRFTKDPRQQFVEDLRLALIEGTRGCELQEGADGKP